MISLYTGKKEKRVMVFGSFCVFSLQSFVPMHVQNNGELMNQPKVFEFRLIVT